MSRDCTELASLAGEDHDSKETLGIVVRIAARALGAECACGAMLSADAQLIEIAAGVGIDNEHTLLGRVVGAHPDDVPLMARLLDHDEPVLEIDDLAGSGVSDELREMFPAGSLAGIRLDLAGRHDGEVRPVGGLVLHWAEPRSLDSERRETLRNIGHLATMALVSSRRHERTMVMLREAEARAATDALTGLGNLRAFREKLLIEVERARRATRPLSLAIIDVDDFKGVNDEHGHRVGDDVLRRLARRVQERVRTGDTLARIGGDEFAWLLPETEVSGARHAAEIVRQAVSGAPFLAVERMTVSIGICELRAGYDAEELYSLADGALYRAKREGRDRVVSYARHAADLGGGREGVDRVGREQTRQSIRVLARAVDSKDPSSQRHSERVAETASIIAEILGWDPRAVERLREVSLVHDVGKIGVPDSILFKPEVLTDEERERVEGHAAIGAEIVRDILTPEQTLCVRGHHERWDGRGYPDRLVGEQIPEGARILAVADSWDVMTSRRPYSAPLRAADALAECLRNAGSQFWPHAVRALEQLHGLAPLGSGPPSMPRRGRQAGERAPRRAQLPAA